MKKMFGKFAALVLAFLMVFSLTGCGMVEVENSAKALEGAVDAMLDESSVSVTANISAKVGEELNLQGLVGELALNKGKNDYDYSINLKMKNGSMSVTMLSQIKKGDKVYTRAMGEEKYSSETADKITTDGIDSSVKEFIGNLDLSTLKKEGKTYVISVGQDYAQDVSGFISGLLAIKDNDAGTYLTQQLGITKDELAGFVNSAFEDNVTVSGFIAAIDELLSALAPEESAITVETLLAGVDAQTLYGIVSSIDSTVAAPTATQTAYAWLISVWGNKKVDDILALLYAGSGYPEYGDGYYNDGVTGGDATEETGPLTVAEIGEILKHALGLENNVGMTVGEVYDILAESFDEFAYMIVGMLGSKEALSAMSNNGAILGIANLENLTVSKLGYSVKIVLNGKDLTIKSIDITVDSDVKYSDYKVAFADIDLNLSFNYDKVSISAPSQSSIA